MKLHGGPAIDWNAGRIEVCQRTLIGWTLLAFGLGIPTALLWSAGGPVDAFTANRTAIGLGGLALATLFFGAAAGYGAFWVLWRRRLTVWRGTGLWRFETGPLGFVAVLSGSTKDAVRLVLRENRYSDRQGPGGRLELQVAGPDLQSFSLGLELPGSREPLHLGEWQTLAEASAERDRWLGLFVNARVETAPRASQARGAQCQHTPHRFRR